MKIIRARHMGMCFGVRDAINLAADKARVGPLTILGDLVHNESVLADLRGRGVRFEREAANVSTAAVMITAHGASDNRIRSVRARGHEVIEATCPLVRFAHGAVARLVREGFHPVIIGKRDHVEVRGIIEDLQEYDVVLSEADVAALRERPRFGVAGQTTQPIERVRHLVRCLRERFPASEVRFIDTVCQPTKQRQAAAMELAAQCDVVLVIGGANSNNTRELAETCRRACPRVHQVRNPNDLNPAWFAPGDVVGLTAGTSTPDWIIDEVEVKLGEMLKQ